MGQNAVSLADAMSRAEIGQATWDDQIAMRDAIEPLRAVAEAARALDAAIGQWTGVALSPDVARTWIALEDALDLAPAPAADLS